MGEYSELLTPQAVYLTVKLPKQGPAMSFYCPWSGREKLYDVLFKTLQGPGVRGVATSRRKWSNLSRAFQFGILPVRVSARVLIGLFSAGLARWRGIGYGWYICEESWSEVLTWLRSPQACDLFTGASSRRSRWR
jgi:hypothetical protein